jgi:hypothetical protein
MKASILFTLLMIVTLASLAQDCDKCFKRRIALYDCDVQVARPANAAAIIAWYNLFWPSAVARSTMHNSDPGKACLSWLDGALINADDLQGGVLKFGQEYANLPPAGPNKSSEYLIESTVTGTEGNYVFTLILETGPSREVVKSVNIPFEATQESAEEAGHKAAAQMMPLVETIRKFEVNKRNSDTEVAIGDYLGVSKSALSGSITIKPSKTLVDIGEVIDVEVTMTDCDGVPLPNREIHFTEGEAKWGDAVMVMDGTKGGEIIPGLATTNEEGKVTVKFKAGNQKGAAVIYGWYVHTKPYGIPYAFMGYSLVQIQVPIPSLWLLTAEFSNSLISKSDTADKFDLGGKLVVDESHSTYTRETSGKLTALIENFALDPVHDFEFNTDGGGSEPLLQSLSGTGSQDIFGQSSRVIDGQLISADIRDDNVSGLSIGKASIHLYYSGEYKSFGCVIGIRAVGAYHGRMYGYGPGLPEWSDYGEDIKDYYLQSGAEGDPDDPADGCRITKTDSGYLIQINKTENKNVSSPGGTDLSTKTSNLTARLVPYNQKSLSGQTVGK